MLSTAIVSYLGTGPRLVPIFHLIIVVVRQRLAISINVHIMACKSWGLKVVIWLFASGSRGIVIHFCRNCSPAVPLVWFRGITHTRYLDVRRVNQSRSFLGAG
jgi:hypothetical protein